MRNSNLSKYLIVVALLLSVVALSLGFAVFSSTLTIKSSATVTGDSSNFSVVLSTSNSTSNQGNVTAIVNPASGGPTGTTATINTSTKDTISNLGGTFTAPGQSISYKFYAYNAGTFLAYLNSINFANASGASAYKKCTPGSGTTASYVTSACNGISLSVRVGGTNGSGGTLYNPGDTGIDSISSHTLAAGAGEEIYVTINYASGSAQADGDFTVTFGDVTLTYGSAD